MSSIMLDSGAYSAYTKGKIIDIDQYVLFLLQHQNLFDYCINLDVIMNAKASYTNWQYLRSFGLNVLPVYHIGTDEIWLKKYLKQTDYIALGAVANLSSTQRMQSLTRIWNSYLTNSEGFPIVNVHGLGVTAVSLMLRYPWFSVDSITPIIAAAYGRIFLPRYTRKNNQDTFSYFNGFFCSVSDQSKQKVGTMTSFLGLPKLIQEKYMDYIEKKGYVLGNLYHQKKRATKQDKRENRKEHASLFSLDQSVKTDAPDTLANSWNQRLLFNVYVWNQLILRMPEYPRKHDSIIPAEIPNHDNKIHIYYGVSTNTHIESIKWVIPQPDILISYAYMTDKLLNTIESYKKIK